MEMFPYAQRGGVADVLHGLPLALSKLQQNVVVIIPFYSKIKTKELGVTPTGINFFVEEERASIAHAHRRGVDVYLLGNPAFGQRPYEGDEFRTAVLFCQSALAAIKELGLRPHIIHCHDWQIGLLPGYVMGRQDSYFADTSVLFTVHNLGYRGWFENERFAYTGLSPHVRRFYSDGEVGFSLLKGGILCAGRGKVNTVSPNYAREITQTELGWGMQDVLREVQVFGILNGIDYDVYDPAQDPHIRFRYNEDNFLAARPKNKAALQRVRLARPDGEKPAEYMSEFMPGCALEEDPDAFLIGMIARVAEQKGLGIMVGALELLLEERHNVQFVFNGQPASLGDDYCREIIQILHPLAASYSKSVLIRFSEEFDYRLAQMMYAGCDALVCTPSYEPCGLEPMKCARYGCIPIVRATGGLADQVVEFDPDDHPDGNGFLFKELEPEAAASAIRRAMHLFYGRRSEWHRLARRCMQVDHSWEQSARQYLNWYFRVRNQIPAASPQH